MTTSNPIVPHLTQTPPEYKTHTPSAVVARLRAAFGACGIPVAHRQADGSYAIPSREEDLGQVYTVTLGDVPTCTCRATVVCWHIARALELQASEPTPAPAPTILRDAPAPPYVRLESLPAGTAFRSFGRIGTVVGPRVGGIRAQFATGGETCGGALLVAPLPANVTPLPTVPTCATPACTHPARRKGYCAGCLQVRAAAATADLFERRAG